MKLKPQDLEKISDLTLRHYNEYAEYFWEGTRDHNVSQNIAALQLFRASLERLALRAPIPLHSERDARNSMHPTDR